MIQAIENEQVFVTNLEKFMGKADKFIKTYYSGVSEQNHVREIMQEMKNLVSDSDLQQLENDYQDHCDTPAGSGCRHRTDLMADCDDSSWF